jgi:hypothetical protein
MDLAENLISMILMMKARADRPSLSLSLADS